MLMKSKYYDEHEIESIDSKEKVIYLKENVTKVRSNKFKNDVFLKIDKFIDIDSLLDKNNWVDNQ